MSFSLLLVAVLSPNIYLKLILQYLVVDILMKHVFDDFFVIIFRDNILKCHLAIFGCKEISYIAVILML